MRNTTKVILIFLIVSISAFTNEYALGQEVNSGVGWTKTLRIRGVLEKMNPFNETKIYSLGNTENTNISVDKKLIQIESIASGFWVALRDSLKSAIRNNDVDVYLARENPEKKLIFIKGIKINSYNILIDSLYANMAKIAQNATTREGIYTFDVGNELTSVKRYFPRRLEKRERVFDLLNMFELELSISVDETGFRIQPKSLLFGSVHWNLPPPRPATVTSEFVLNSGFFDRFKDGFGIYLDLTEEKTYKYLVENGIGFSGEGNIMPFFDLITMFHYDYMFYSESENVIDLSAETFKFDRDELRKNLLNRYNEMTFNYLYGQPPQWWDSYSKGAIMNGVYSIDSTNAPTNQNQGGN